MRGDRRAVFTEIGGFDQERFRRPSVEDIELGYRLRRAGHRILLDKALQGTHLKRWTVASLVRTDVMGRAVPWTRLILETGQILDDLNLQRDQRWSAVLVGLPHRAAQRTERSGAALGAALHLDLFEQPARFPASC